MVSSSQPPSRGSRICHRAVQITLDPDGGLVVVNLVFLALGAEGGPSSSMLFLVEAIEECTREG